MRRRVVQTPTSGWTERSNLAFFRAASFFISDSVSLGLPEDEVKLISKSNVTVAFPLDPVLLSELENSLLFRVQVKY